MVLLAGKYDPYLILKSDLFNTAILKKNVLILVLLFFFPLFFSGAVGI